jgi:hypothetical protein
VGFSSRLAACGEGTGATRRVEGWRGEVRFPGANQSNDQSVSYSMVYVS